MLPASRRIDDFFGKVKFLDTIKDFDDYLVFVDLWEAIPCNVSRLIMEGAKQIELYAGMNLAMVIELIILPLIGADSNYQEKVIESIDLPSFTGLT